MIVGLGSLLYGGNKGNMGSRIRGEAFQKSRPLPSPEYCMHHIYDPDDLLCRQSLPSLCSSSIKRTLTTYCAHAFSESMSSLSLQNARLICSLDPHDRLVHQEGKQTVGRNQSTSRFSYERTIYILIPVHIKLLLRSDTNLIHWK